MGDAEACRRLPQFPNRDNLYRWIRMERAREPSATEMPGRLARMRCARGESSPRYAAWRPRAKREGPRWRRGPSRPAGATEALTFRGPDGADEGSRDQARRGAGGVRRPKSTGPGLFDQRGEVADRGAGKGEVTARQAQGRDRDALDTEEHLPQPSREGR